MSDLKFTKQGIRDLNPVGHNGHKNHGAKCKHHDESVLIGKRWTSDGDGWYEAYQVPVYGFRCMWCGRIRPDPYDS